MRTIRTKIKPQTKIKPMAKNKKSLSQKKNKPLGPKKKGPLGPCQSMILVQCEIFERLEDGKCSGRPIQTDSKLYTFTGVNFDECKKKTDEFLNKLN